MVLSKMIAILTLLLSYANTSVQCWENLFFMGVHVAKVKSSFIYIANISFRGMTRLELSQ